MSDFNARVIAEFRANEGRVGGNFEGADMVLLHHVGRSSGTEYVAPVVFFTQPAAPGTIYVVASAAGAPSHPQWYSNLVEAGSGTVEVGTEQYEVAVDDLAGAERDRVFADIVARAPGFGDYEKKTAGIRTIPVLALSRIAS